MPKMQKPQILIFLKVQFDFLLTILALVDFVLFTDIYCIFLSQENQKDLENSTEHLSEYLERDITSDMLIDIKQKVQDKYR